MKINDLQDKVNEYEEKILNIGAIQQKEKPSMANIFGKEGSQLSAETKKMVDMVMRSKGKESQ